MFCNVRYNYFYLTIFILFSLIKSGFAIHCYSCDTIDDHRACADPFNTSLFQPVMCLNENFACLKQVRLDVALNTTFLTRRCVQKHYCEVFTTVSDICSTCTNDFCNSTSKVTSLLITPVVCLLVYLFNF